MYRQKPVIITPIIPMDDFNASTMSIEEDDIVQVDSTSYGCQIITRDNVYRISESKMQIEEQRAKYE